MLKQTLKTVLMVILIAGTFTACSSTKKNTGSLGANGQNQAQNESSARTGNEAVELNGDSDSKKAGGLVTVYFDYNSASLRQDTVDALQNNISFLKANPSVKVQVEGHCDERGSVQFNLALGEKRAKAVKEYLTSNGVEGSRVSIISLGKERPVAFGHDDGAWSQNRRGNFVVTAK